MNNPKILVLYFTQSGQLRDIIDSVLRDVKGHAEIDMAEITPQKPYPFPWTPYVFFDTMPETVEHLPPPVHPIRSDVYDKEYDLVILAYQPWFLNPSQPVTAFLQSDCARVLENKPVLTIIGSRNMWLHAQEKVKEYLLQRHAKLVGNIVLFDTNSNIVSTLTVIRWSFKGQKEASGLLPAAGVQDKDIKAASRFGEIILDSLRRNELEHLHENLIRLNAVQLDPGLVLLEQRGIKNFRFWSKYIREKGGPGAPARKGRVMLFQRLLIVAIFILSPISALSAFIKLQLHKRKLAKDVDYFKGVDYEKDRI